MENKKLTDNQCSQLFEIINFFYNYKQIEIGRFEGMFTGFKEYPPTKNYDHIHWYELCCTHLKNKLFTELYKSPLKITKANEHFGNCLIMLNVHPVDYLWAEFKRLKISKRKN